MLLKIFEKNNEKFFSKETSDIKKELSRRSPFLHFLFRRKNLYVAFCSNSSNFYVMDKDLFSSHGQKYLAVNLMKPFAKVESFSCFLPASTTKCNMNCRYCVGYGGLKSGKDSSLEIIKAATEFIARNQKEGVIVDFVTSGEALLNFPLFSKTIDITKKSINVKQFKLSTNGTLLPEKFLKILKENPFYDSFQISCDGPPEIQDSLRPLKNGLKSSQIVENNLRKLISKNMNFTVKITLTEKHLGKESDVVKYFLSLGVKRLFITIVGDIGKEALSAEKIRSMKQYEWLIESQLKIKELCDIINLKCLLPAQKSIGNTQICGCAVSSSFVITPEGLVTPCAMLGDEYDVVNHNANKLVFGRYDFKNKKIILDKDRLNEVRTWYRKVKKCYECDFKLCWGGCLLSNIRKNGTIYLPDKTHCKERKEETLAYFRYLAESQLIKLKPYLKIAKNRTYLIGQNIEMPVYNNFNSVPRTGNAVGSAVLVRLNPKSDNLEILLSRMLKLNERIKGLVLFLLSPPCKQQLNTRETVFFKDFLYSLKTNGIPFLVTKKIKISDSSDKKEKDFYEYFNIPSDCSNCLELFKVKQNSKVEFCDGRSGPKIDDVFNRNELYELYLAL
ncbi:MAG: radical SAM protein [Candidatus Diapherotrites archaeon]